MEVCPYNYFWWFRYFWGPWVSFLTIDEFSVRVAKKLLQRLVSHELTAYLSVLNLFLTQWIMAILSKECTPENLEPHNHLKLSFTNIWGLCSSLVECESFLESNSPDILALCETNLDDSNDSGNFCEGLFSFNPKRFYYSHTWSCSLCKRRTSFYTGLISRKLCRFLLMFSKSFTSLSVLLPLSITFFVVMHGFWFYSI